MVELADRDPARLKPIAGVSGDFPIFGPRLRDALVWGAHHYVAPVSVMLERSAPPNLPTRPVAIPAAPAPPASASRHALAAVVEAALAGRRHPVRAFLDPPESTAWLTTLAPLLGAGLSALVVAATAAEVAILAEMAREQMGPAVVEVSGDLDDSEVTRRWAEAAAEPGRLVIGTPRVAAWPVAGLVLAVVVEEGRRAMKDRQTPTVHVRRLLTTRARLEGFSQAYIGPTPSVEVLAAGAEVVAGGSRAWPLVEVVDRREDPPGSGLVSERSRRAIAATAGGGGTVFVFTHRRGYAPAFRCAACRELRRCRVCGSRPEPGEACRRCGASSEPCLNCGAVSFEPLGAGVGRVVHELRGSLGERVGAVPSPAPVVVGTERDLAGAGPVDLAVAVDADGLVLGSHFRAGEEALRILARLAGRVGRGSGRRLVLQTAMPDHPLITALRRGDPLPYLRHEIEERHRLGYPPAAEMMVVELRGEVPDPDGSLREPADDAVAILGPASTYEGRRWLVQGPGLGGYKVALRPVVQRWRDSGATVRIDVDPLDL